MPRQRTAPSPVTSPAPAPARRTAPRPALLLPSPTATPFTFGYATVLLVTSLFAEYADPSLVHALYQGSSTDVSHLMRSPVVVMLTSALWVAGGITSSYTL